MKSHKIYLSLAIASMALVGQGVWACERPQVSEYGYVGCLSDGIASAVKNNKYGFIDKTGQVVIPFQFDKVADFSDGVAYVKQDGKWGFIDKTGKIVITIPTQLDAGDLILYHFSEGLAEVRQNGKYGFIDKTGKIVIPTQFYYAWRFEEGLARVKQDQNGDWGYLDKTGKIVIPFQFDKAWEFSNGMAKVYKNQKYGFIDKTGREIFPLIYDSISEDYWKNHITITAKRNGKTVVLAKSGVEYDDSGKYLEDRMWVEKGGRYGYIDSNAKEVIPLIYQDPRDFSNGLARVKKDGKYGYIDTNGKTVIDFKYGGAGNFENGQAKASFGDDGKSPNWFSIDKTGKILTTRISLADFRKKLEQGDDVYYNTNDGSGEGMIFEVKGNLIQVQTKERQCTQRDYKGNCQNYVNNQVSKWVKRTEVYPVGHFD